MIRRLERTIAGVLYRRLIRWTMPTNECVQDLTQDSLKKLLDNDARALRKFRFEYENSLYGFVRTVAANVAEDYHRKVGREPVEPLADFVDPPHPEDYSARAERDALLDHIDNYLKTQTSELERSIFWLHYKQGYSAREIAEIRGIQKKVKDIEYVLWKIIRLLRGKFNGPFEGPPEDDENQDDQGFPRPGR